MPGQTSAVTPHLQPRLSIQLQWRAGQLPGQTSHGCSQVWTGRSHTFNGGPGNCPAKPASSSREGRAMRSPGSRSTASMEGRAIARPNPNTMVATEGRSGLVKPMRFNGGPGNCPAKPGDPWTIRAGWSACGRFNGGPGNCPAKRLQSPTPSVRTARSFNGGPGNCPAKPCRPWRSDGPAAAPSMEGRAIARPNLPGARSSCKDRSFNGGPGNCPAKRPRPRPGLWRSRCPSMEGRAIARPNRAGAKPGARRARPLQWRAGQLPGQTHHR